MFNFMKPGHVLRFGICPSTKIPPGGVVQQEGNDNAAETRWPVERNLGLVQCLSHPSGNIGAIAADVAKHLRTTPGSISRTAGYSRPGRLLMRRSDRVVGQVSCDFVGYVDGQTNYIESARTVLSKDFSGCLMVEYIRDGQRRVAHAAASRVPEMDCRQAFLRQLQRTGATLNGWFRLFVDTTDGGRKVNTFQAVSRYIGGNVNNLVTFGVVTAEGQAYSIDAFKPDGILGNDWVVCHVSQKNMSHRLEYRE